MMGFEPNELGWMAIPIGGHGWLFSTWCPEHPCEFPHLFLAARAVHPCLPEADRLPSGEGWARAG